MQASASNCSQGLGEISARCGYLKIGPTSHATPRTERNCYSVFEPRICYNPERCGQLFQNADRSAERRRFLAVACSAASSVSAHVRHAMVPAIVDEARCTLSRHSVMASAISSCLRRPYPSCARRPPSDVARPAPLPARRHPSPRAGILAPVFHQRGSRRPRTP